VLQLTPRWCGRLAPPHSSNSLGGRGREQVKHETFYRTAGAIPLVVPFLLKVISTLDPYRVFLAGPLYWIHTGADSLSLMRELGSVPYLIFAAAIFVVLRGRSETVYFKASLLAPVLYSAVVVGYLFLFFRFFGGGSEEFWLEPALYFGYIGLVSGCIYVAVMHSLRFSVRLVLARWRPAA